MPRHFGWPSSRDVGLQGPPDAADTAVSCSLVDDVRRTVKLVADCLGLREDCFDGMIVRSHAPTFWWLI